MEYLSHGISAAPGQLWRNVRTGDVLFVYQKQSRLEGILCDGRKFSDEQVLKLIQGINGWKCLYLDQTGNVNHNANEF